MEYALPVLLIFSLKAYYLTVKILPKFKDMFLKAHLSGVDLCKPKIAGKSPAPIPEAMGAISGFIFLMIMFLYIPVLFASYFHQPQNLFPHHELVHFVAALLSICCMLLLGFVDDVLDLRWRHKLVLPTLASLPLLMIYHVTYNSTTVIIPKPLRGLIGHDLTLGPLYYVYMGMLAVFCTNAINILAGINGLEVGQSLIIAVSLMVFNVIELFGDCWKAHLFSLSFIAPFFATSLALFKYNKYPAKLFVGDTFCYFAGMTFAVVGILGHFSKTMLLFFIPQVFNFLYSVPQLFHLVPCPRHRLPQYDSTTDKVTMSFSEFKKSSLHPLGKLFLNILRSFHLVHYKEFEKDGEEFVQCSNLTLIVLTLKVCGPLPERVLTIYLLLIQVFCSFVAFFIRYALAWMFYDV